jgi:hypothetical protein
MRARRGEAGPVNRRVLLAFSILLSLALHAALVMYSDRIALLGLASSARPEEFVFRVNLVEDVPAPPEETLRLRGVGDPASPVEVTDLIERELARLEPQDLLTPSEVEIPQLAERLAEKNLEREHNLERDEQTLEKIDARILEIAAEDARRDIEVSRRLVRPSGTRVVEEDEFPVLRAEGAVAELLPLRGPGASSFASEPLGDGEELLTPPAAVAMAPAMDDLPMLEPLRDSFEQRVEEKVARAAVAEELVLGRPYEFLDDLLDIEVASYIPPDERLGYFRLRITPKKGADIPPLPKDVTFVIDASNSIVQRKLDITIGGIEKAVKMLRPEDRFNIVIFRDSPKHFQSERVPATPENKAAALAFLKGQKSFGETDVFNAIRPVVMSPFREDYPAMVLVITDGRPTKGVRDGRTIINLLTGENTDRLPIFAFSGGRTANRYLLDLLAYRNKGESYVSPEIDTIGRDLPSFFAQLNDPLLKDLQADYANVDEGNVYPKELPDFFRSRAVTIYGRFDPARDDEFVMRLVGKAGPKKKEVMFQADLKEARTGDAEIARNWAFRKVYSIIGEMCEVGETPELRAQLRETSRKYGIRTSYDE